MDKLLAPDNTPPCSLSASGEPPPVGQPAKLPLRRSFSELARGRFTSVTDAPIQFQRIQAVTVCTTFDEALGELRVTEA